MNHKLKIGDCVHFRFQGTRWLYGEVIKIAKGKVTFNLPQGSITHHIDAKVVVDLEGLEALNESIIADFIADSRSSMKKQAAQDETHNQT